MATFRQRGNKWQARVQRRGFAPATKSFSEKKDAERWARSIERAIDLGEYTSDIEARQTTLAKVIERYLRDVTPSKKGAPQEKYRLKNIAADALGKLSLKGITTKAVADYRDRRLREVSPTTVAHDLASLSAVLEHCRLEWSIPVTNTVRAIRKPSLGPERTRRLEGDEESKLLAELRKARNPWIAPMFEVALETAARRGELLRLRWVDVDLKQRVAVLRDTKTGDDRAIPLSIKAASVLSALPRSLDGRVFPVSDDAVGDVFRAARRRANVSNFRWHDIRHEGVSRLFEKGLDTMEVASVSGHQTLGCLKRYTHMRAERIAKKLG